MKRIIALLSIVVVVTVVWTGAWFYVAGEIDRQVKLYAAPVPGQPQILCGDLSTTGFPFRFDVTCADMVVNDGDVSIALPEVKLTALVYRPTHFIAFAKGPLSYTDAFFGTNRQLNWTSFEASLRMNGWQLARFSAVAEDLTFSDKLFGYALIGNAAHIEAHMLGTPAEAEDDDTTNIGLFARADTANIPGFTINDAALVFEADVTRLPADIRMWQRADLLRLWQTMDGAVKLHRIEIVQPDASVTLAGDVALNENGEAEGDFNLTSTDIGPRLDLFLTPEVRNIFIGNQQADGSHKQVFTVKRGAILAGFAPIGVIPPLY